MDSLIKEINENLKAIIDNLKETQENSINTLDNIQIQMDKKVEEAKKYKVQVDSAKERIKTLEDEIKALELSLSELTDKYGKMNLVSLIEAGNREIKNKINDNLKEINKEKEHIAELTNKARTIKDLLINLKKDRTIKEERLENIKVVYNYYNERINDVIDYAFNHSLNLSDYKNNVRYSFEEEDDDNNVKAIELENTMVFDEIANIDDNKNFKDEMTFVDEQINTVIDEEDINFGDVEKIIDEPIDTTQVFDTIFNTESLVDEEQEDEVVDEIVEEGLNNDVLSEKLSNYVGDTNEIKPVTFENENISNDDLVNALEPNEVEDKNIVEDNFSINTDLFDASSVKEEVIQDEDKVLDEENELRINKINDLFANFENNTVSMEKVEPLEVKGIEDKIDNAYMDIFGKPLDSDELNRKDPTLTDIFGNPVSGDEDSNETKISKKIEELFVENGIDFNKFREDEKNYLKQIYDEEKFNNIINTLKSNKINLDNIYSAFNIFGEISANELENLISKLLNVGQSVEAIGLILEKLPKVKKYSLDEAIMSYGDYIKDIDITELVMKAKELYNGGNN